MKPTLAIIALASLLTACCKGTETRCGVVVSKYQTGRSGESYHFGVRFDDGSTIVENSYEERWAVTKEGDRICCEVCAER